MKIQPYINIAMSPLKIESESNIKRTIATFAGILTTITVLMFASNNPHLNLLTVGFLAYVIAFVISLVSRTLGVGIVLVMSLLLLRGCAAS